ncbi:phosphotransferase enzyme family protein [Moniliophthora roreri]|nr:phosphotransferase enzyme family protein [Moniliophthora roreri]
MHLLCYSSSAFQFPIRLGHSFPALLAISRLHPGYSLIDTHRMLSLIRLKNTLTHIWNWSIPTDDKMEDDEAYGRSRANLQRLEGILKSISGALTDAHLRRFTLHHDDLRPSNVLLDPDTGIVTRIIDWEYHSIQPAVLVAEYPSWLIYSGQLDPRFATDHTWWFDSPEECQHYRDLFEQVVKEKDPDYHDCLIRGKNLRDGIYWLNPESRDPGCDRMAKWMDATFGKEGEMKPFEV